MRATSLWIVIAGVAGTLAGCANTRSAGSRDTGIAAPPASMPRSCSETGASPAPMLIGQIGVSRTQLAFGYAGAVWLVGREGGAARRIAGPAGAPTDYPVFSPDGSQLAFARQVDGNWDVYVMPSAGGEPTRLTEHPSRDVPVGWTPDGKRVLFSSSRMALWRRLFTVQADGQRPLPSELPLPRAGYGAYSPDGTRFVYAPLTWAVDNWRFYRGGAQGFLWLVTLDGGALERLPRGDYNDLLPMWIGDRIYFLSDRTGTFNLYAYDLAGRRTRQLTAFTAHGIRTVSAADDAIAFVCDGRIHLHELAAATTRVVAVSATPEIDELAPRTVDAARAIEHHALSRAGDAVVFSARGDIFLVDPRSGRAHNVTQTPAAAERSAVLSPDGGRIAYFSDESGEYQLHVRDVTGGAANPRVGKAEVLDIEPHPSFYRRLVWSPDSSKLAFLDKRLALWCADLTRRAVHQIDRSAHPDEEFVPAWSPDSRFLAYAKHLPNRIATIFLHDLAAGTTHQLSDGRTHAESPIFDASGNYLYFLSSPNAGTAEFGWGVLNAVMARPHVTWRAHLVLLRRDQPSPLLPGGDPNPAAAGALRAASRSAVRIDFDGLDRRIVDLPIELRDLAQLIAGPPGRVFVLARHWPSSQFAAEPWYALYRYDLAAPKQLEAGRLVDRLDEVAVSGDGERLLYARANDWFLVPVDAAAGAQPGAGKLDLAGLRIETAPRREAQQMVHEAWRIMRDWFYDPGHHGQDLAALERHYAGYLPSIARAADLTELMNRMLGHISVGHLRVWGSDASNPRPAQRTGLLGADYELDHGRYRFRRVYRSTAMGSPTGAVIAPLDGPGVAVRDGDYLLEVEGQAVDATRSVDGTLENRAGQATQLRIGPSPDGAGARVVTVYPVSDEGPLRRASWAEANRRRVHELSGGKLGYIYAADYGVGGTLDFMRGLLGYRDRAGIVIDQRHNGGGITPDYLIEWLRRRAIYDYMFREGDDIATPVNPGPPATVLIIDEDNFSAAETFAFMYQLGKVGPLVGMRTGGGGIGPFVYTPRLLDGGRIQVPDRAAFNPDGSSFGIENRGISPDHEVAITPRDFIAGRDPQLDEAVRIALSRLAANPRPVPRRPKYPVHP